MGGVTLVAVAIVVMLAFRETPRFAVVLATPQDCLRAFDDQTCRKVVNRALDVHYRVAPQYTEAATCALAFGADACMEVPRSAQFQGRFIPALAAVLVSPEGLDDASSLVPLHAARIASRSDPGKPRKVFFGGTQVGFMTSQRFGGAAITQVRDRSGVPITVERLQRLRGKQR